MERRGRQRTAGATALLMALAVVASVLPSVGSARATGGQPTASTDLVLRVDTAGGFVPLDFLLRDIPEFSLYGDGTAIWQEWDAASQGSARPNLRRLQLNKDGARWLLAEARAAGLTSGDRDIDFPCVTDMPTTVFTTAADGRTSRVSAYALGFDPNEGLPLSERVLAGLAEAVAPDDGCDVDERGRDRLQAFAALVGDLPAALPPGSIAEAEAPYPIERLQIVVEPASEDSALGWRDPASLPPPVRWPLRTPLADLGVPYEEGFGTDLRCAVLADADAARLVAALAGTDEAARWESGDSEYYVVPRPLLPDEAGCRAG